MSDGIWAINFCKASKPPAEAPMATIYKPEGTFASLFTPAIYY
jgi:hypothetical protein